MMSIALRQDLLAFTGACLEDTPDSMLIGTCGHCNVRDLELVSLAPECFAWPLQVACKACKAELMADDENPVDHEARDGT